MMTGLYRPTMAACCLMDGIVTGLRPNRVTRLGISRTFQTIRLFDNMTVLDNVLVGMNCRLRASWFGAIVRPPWVRREERRARQRAQELLDYVGLLDRAEELAKNLPYGEQRLLEIARALATEPKLLLLDEPSAGMNPRETDDLTAFIARLRQEFGLTILLIEHHMEVVWAFPVASRCSTTAPRLPRGHHRKFNATLRSSKPTWGREERQTLLALQTIHSYYVQHSGLARHLSGSQARRSGHAHRE